MNEINCGYIIPPLTIGGYCVTGTTGATGATGATGSPCPSPPTKFIDISEEFDTNDLYSFSELINTSLTKTVMYFVKNIDIYEITAHLQVSPNGIDFINEPTVITLDSNILKFIVPCIFSKFTRVAVKNIYSGETSRVKIWYQAQE
ncbi:DUF6385 domain-containing protein [Clostridium sp.]